MTLLILETPVMSGSDPLSQRVAIVTALRRVVTVTHSDKGATITVTGADEKKKLERAGFKVAEIS